MAGVVEDLEVALVLLEVWLLGGGLRAGVLSKYLASVVEDVEVALVLLEVLLSGGRRAGGDGPTPVTWVMVGMMAAVDPEQELEPLAPPPS